jgi:iron complex outermembrane recepter protein
MNTTRNPKKTVRAALLMSAVALMLTTPFEASEAQESQPGARTVEEVVVTGRRRQESMQDVPVSVTALTPEQLRDQDILNTEELSDFIPNLRIGQGQRAGSDQFSIRGVTRQGPGGDPTTNPGVGLYLNGVYIPAGIANHLSLHDARQVEVFRGPQGTLFGRNTTGGAINIVTHRPELEPGGEILARTGSHNRRDARVVVNAPLGERVYGRVSAALDRRDGYYKNLLLGTDHNDRNIRSVDAALRWEPIDSLTLDMAASYHDRRDNNRGGDCRFLSETGFQRTHMQNGGGSFEDACRETEAAGRYKFYSAWPMFLDAQHETLTVEGHWAAAGPVGFLEAFGVAGNAGYFEVNYDFMIDQHYNRELLETRGTHGGGQTEEYRHAELIFEGTAGIADMLLGFNYYEEAGWQNKRSFDRCYNLYGTVVDTGLSVTCPNPGGFYFRNQPYNTSGSGPSPFMGNVEATGETYSAFFHTKLDVTTWLRLDAGVRYTHESRDFKNLEAQTTPHEAGFLDFQWVLNDDTVELWGRGSDSWSEVTPMVSANFMFDQIGPATGGMAYLLWARGFTSGGFNSELPVRSIPEMAPLQTFDPEIVDNYELGLKTDLFNSRLQLNVALFRMEYTDKQESIGIDNSDGTFGPVTAIQITSNAAEARIDGFEIEFVALLGEQWRIDGGLARQKPKFTEFFGFNPATGQIEDLSNLRLNTEPELTFTGNIHYLHLLGSGASINTRVGVYWQDETDTAVAEFGVTDRTVCYQDAYATVNGRATYSNADERIAISLFGRNLANEDVMLNCGLSTGRGRWVPMFDDRRTWGVEAVYRF